MTDRLRLFSTPRSYNKKSRIIGTFYENKLSRGLEPPTSALPRRRATDCAKTACCMMSHTQ